MKINYSRMLAKLTEFEADPLQLLEQAEELRRLVISDGVVSEKVSVKDGVLEVTERNAATAIQAVRLKFDIIKWVVSQAEAHTEENTECRLIVTGLDMSTPTEVKKYG